LYVTKQENKFIYVSCPYQNLFKPAERDQNRIIYSRITALFLAYSHHPDPPSRPQSKALANNPIIDFVNTPHLKSSLRKRIYGQIEKSLKDEEEN